MERQAAAAHQLRFWSPQKPGVQQNVYFYLSLSLRHCLWSVPFAPEEKELMVLFSLFHPSFPFINNEFQEIKKIGRFLSLSLSLGRFVRGEIRYTLATRSCPPSEEEEEKEKHIYSRPEMFSKRSCKGNRTFLIHDRCHLLLSAVSLQTRLVFTLADICTQEFRREIIRKMNDIPTLREKSWDILRPDLARVR